MTTKSAWTQTEQRICRKFGGRRTPLSGSNSQHETSSDCIKLPKKFSKFYIEIKFRKIFSHHKIFRDAKEKAIKENKIPTLVTHEKYKEEDLVTLRLDDFLKLIEEDKKDVSNKEVY